MEENITNTDKLITLSRLNKVMDDLKTIALSQVKTEIGKKQDVAEGKQLSSNDFTDELKAKLEGVESGAQVNAITGIKGDNELEYRTGEVNLTKDNIGLSNVDNTSDLNKPISTATQTALDSKSPLVHSHGSNGIENSAITTEKIADGAVTKDKLDAGITLGVEDGAVTTEKIADGAVTLSKLAPDVNLDGKVDKVDGKQLSTEDFTTEEKNKLASLSNYDPTSIQNEIEAIKKDIDSLLGESASEAIDKFNEILNFLSGITDTQTLEGMLAALKSEIQVMLDLKVDKVVGKQLSTEDFTTEEKSKLSGIESGAQVNAITGVKGDNELEYRTGEVNLTKDNIGLSNVDNTSDLDKPISTSTQGALNNKVDKVEGKQLSSNDYTDLEKSKLSGIESGAQVNTITGIKGDNELEYRTGNVTLSKANLGLGNVDNTSDLNKPISTATQTALDSKVDKEVGKGLSSEDFTTEEKSKLEGIESGAQVNTITGVKGEAESSYRTGNVNLTKSNIGLSNVDNTSDVNKPISTATQTALNTKVDKVTGKGLSTNDYTTEEKSKLSGIESGAQVNTLEVIKVNGEVKTPDTKSVDITVPTKVSDIMNDKAYQTKSEVDAAIQTASLSMYKRAGRIEASRLTSDLLNAEHENFLYNVTEAFVSNDLFEDGAGVYYGKGQQVLVSHQEDGTYLFDAVTGVIDYSQYETQAVPVSEIIALCKSILG